MADKANNPPEPLRLDELAYDLLISCEHMEALNTACEALFADLAPYLGPTTETRALPLLLSMLDNERWAVKGIAERLCDPTVTIILGGDNHAIR